MLDIRYVIVILKADLNLKQRPFITLLGEVRAIKRKILVMKKMFQKIGNILEYVWNVVGCILVLSCVVAGLCLLGKAAQILSPVITFGFFAIGTMFACTNGRLNRIICLGGLVIYIVSFAVVGPLGAITAQFICLLGILMWFKAAISAFCHYFGNGFAG